MTLPSFILRVSPKIVGTREITAAPATAAPATIAPSCAEELDAAEEALAHADTNETKTNETSTRSKNAASSPPPIAFALLDRLRCWTRSVRLTLRQKINVAI